MLAIIGGSSLTKLPELSITDRKIVRTPYGLASSPVLSGKLGSQDIIFLARHGFAHTVAPHEINYRANIWALHSIGAEYIVAVSSVISINDRFELVLPDDLIDYTYGRKDTFFEGQEEPVVHTDFLEPYSAGLREKIAEHAQQHQMPLYTQAVYGCLQGPRWPTRAEIQRYRRDGVDVLGMTGMPEAVLARELGMKYAHFCGITDIRCLSGKMTDTGGCGMETELAVLKIRSLLAGL